MSPSSVRHFISDRDRRSNSTRRLRVVVRTRDTGPRDFELPSGTYGQHITLVYIFQAVAVPVNTYRCNRSIPSRAPPFARVFFFFVLFAIISDTRRVPDQRGRTRKLNDYTGFPCRTTWTLLRERPEVWNGELHLRVANISHEKRKKLRSCTACVLRAPSSAALSHGALYPQKSSCISLRGPPNVKWYDSLLHSRGPRNMTSIRVLKSLVATEK